MKVWIGYKCHYDYSEVTSKVVKVFDCEVKALLWEEDKEFLESHNEETDWRSVAPYEVE